MGKAIAESIVIGIWLFFVGAWFVNGYKLTQCDFDAPYKCEGIHGVGLIAPLAMFTVWYDGK